MSNNSFKIKHSSVHVPIDLTTLVSPEAGEIACDINDGNKLKRYDSISATWTELGSGAGGINYLSDNSDFEAGVAGYSTYADAAGEAPVDGTSGTATITFTDSAVSPLRGTKSGLLSKPSSNEQGEGVSYDFTIDAADKAQILRISFDYETSVDYADGDIRVYVYDVTNSRLIEVVDRDLYGSSFGKYTGTFQTSSDSTSYRLIWHVASTNAASYTVKLDNVVVGPQPLIKGAIVTDEEDLVISLTNFGNATVTEAKYSRVGDKMFGRIRIAIGATLPTGSLTINLSNHVMVDVLANTIGTASSFVGSACHVGAAVQGTTTSFQLYGDDGTGTWTASNPITWAAGNVLDVNFVVPILGWSSNMTLSEDAGNREIACKVSQAVVTSIPDNVNTKYGFTAAVGIGYDTASGWDTVNHRYNVPESGFYDLTGVIVFASTGATERNAGVAIYINGSSIGGSLGRALNANSGAIETTKVEKLNKGDFVELYAYQNDVAGATALNATQGALFVAKRSSPQTVAASEIVACSYATDTPQAIANGVTSTIVFEDKILDTHNSYNTGIFTAPQSGYYAITSNINSDAVGVTAVGGFFILSVAVDGTIVASAPNTPDATTASRKTLSISDYRYLSKGQTVEIKLQNGSGSASIQLRNDTRYNWLSIVKQNGVS